VVLLKLSHIVDSMYLSDIGVVSILQLEAVGRENNRRLRNPREASKLILLSVGNSATNLIRVPQDKLLHKLEMFCSRP
jgi:hypothetical protein